MTRIPKGRRPATKAGRSAVNFCNSPGAFPCAIWNYSGFANRYNNSKTASLPNKNRAFTALFKGNAALLRDEEGGCHDIEQIDRRQQRDRYRKRIGYCERANHERAKTADAASEIEQN